MAWLRPRLYVAFDAASVAAATVCRGFAGRRLERVQRVALAPGQLEPSPLDANLLDAAAVRRALDGLFEEPFKSGPATLLLPDGVARTALVETPPDVTPEAFARFRLAPSLPFPAAEAVFDAQPVGRGRALIVAVRRSIVESYERLLAELGLRPDRVELAPLAALEGLKRLAPGPGSTVDVILGDVAVSLAAWNAGELRVFRSRRRETGALESAWLRQEIMRTARLAGDGHAPRIRVAGPGGIALAAELRRLGEAAEPAWHASGDALPADGAELAWLAVGA